MMEGRIEPLKEGDLEEVAGLLGACFTIPWSYESIGSLLGNPRAMNLVYFEGERAVGFLNLERVLDEATIYNVAVLPERRNQGIGKKLLEEAVKALEETGCLLLMLEVREDNTPAISCYRALDFKEVGRRKGYYDMGNGTFKDALLMDKVLGAME